VSDRILREVNRATWQRLTHIEKTIQGLQLRTHPGAVRCSDIVTVSTAASIPTPLITLEVLAGRWRLSYTGTASMNNAPGTESLFCRPVVAEGSGCLPQFSWSVPHTAGPTTVPISGEGEFHSDAVTAVSLEVWSLGLTECTWSLALFAQPV
jgi:hypothetical protein